MKSKAGRRVHLWLRAETRADEHRTPLTPTDAATLIAAGIDLTVERSARRIFDDSEYEGIGCELVSTSSWMEAPSRVFILGLKELPETPERLHHRHIYFGHAYKGQSGADRLLDRFRHGGGKLLDLEYLVDDQGVRLAAFGHWAGYMGAALGVLQARARQSGRAAIGPLSATAKDRLDRDLSDDTACRPPLRALVIGAKGRCGRGAAAALATAKVDATLWDIAETADLNIDALLAHDLLINTVGIHGEARPFLVPNDLARPSRRLGTVVDVTCDLGSSANALPIYRCLSNWARPVLSVACAGDGSNLDIIAIDNLPSLLPRESSEHFSSFLAPHLLTLADPKSVWETSLFHFHRALGQTADRP
ncbi:MAG: saccharopine dehydrogenase [Alphaproteobacteria bacterium]|nr:saccharopine dehydrogenase [Alphaproteobacteria bacterium]